MNLLFNWLYLFYFPFIIRDWDDEIVCGNVLNRVSIDTCCWFYPIGALVIILLLCLQDEKNQLLITNMWLKMVRAPFSLPLQLDNELMISKCKMLPSLFFSLVALFVVLLCIGLERLQSQMEREWIWWRQGSTDPTHAYLEARRPHVQQVNTFPPWSSTLLRNFP